MKSLAREATVAVVAAIVVIVVFAASCERRLGLIDFAAAAVLIFGTAEERWAWTVPCGIVSFLAMKTRVRVRIARSLARVL